jgi:dTDP-4-dehydrorhamnose 3,5-epimerase
VGEVTCAIPVVIEGVNFTPLRTISDDRGSVMHMLRVDSAQFEGFGEIYFSVVRAGAVKAWKRHRLMVQNLAVPVGSIHLVIYDDRPGSVSRGKVQEIVTGAALEQYGLVRIPPMVWYGFAGLGCGDALIANCASLPHDPAEVERLPERSDAIPYSW